MNKVNGNQSKCKKNATEANYKQKQTKQKGEQKASVMWALAKQIKRKTH